MMLEIMQELCSALPPPVPARIPSTTISSVAQLEALGWQTEGVSVHSVVPVGPVPGAGGDPGVVLQPSSGVKRKKCLRVPGGPVHRVVSVEAGEELVSLVPL